MAKLQEPKSPRAIVFRVELDGVDPCIWREFQVPLDLSLSDLHDVLQVVLGWTNSHLHEFVIRGEHYMEDESFGKRSPRRRYHLPYRTMASCA